MRLLAVFACVAALTAAPALGCPRRLLCVVQPDAIATYAPARIEIPRARTRAAVPDVHRIQLAPRARLAVADVSRTTPDPELPWFWRMLREQLHAHLPHHDDARFSFVVSPVVVTSPSDTIPGLGVAGDF